MDPLVSEIVSLLKEAQLDEFEERAGILEFDAGLGREHAECLALLGVLCCHPEVLVANISVQGAAKGLPSYVKERLHQSTKEPSK